MVQEQGLSLSQTVLLSLQVIWVMTQEEAGAMVLWEVIREVVEEHMS